MRLPANPFLWPLFVAASTSELAGSFLKCCGDALAGQGDNTDTIALGWTTPNSVLLELASMQLRDFSAGEIGQPTIVCAPYSLHAATIADFAQGHSVVEALRQSGVSRVFLTDWRSATPSMRYFTIDTYLADLNIAIDEVGPPVDLIGLCQGGWMALVFAARFPEKVRRLVLVGAPIDIRAAESNLTRNAADLPLSAFENLVRLGDGRVLGRHALKLWGSTTKEPEGALQVPFDDGNVQSELKHRFDRWYAWPIDLPGTYYLQIVRWLFKENQIAEGRFVALGRTIDVKIVQVPMYLLGAGDDEVTDPKQLLASAALVRTPKHCIETAIEPCGHLALFLGARTMAGAWRRVARWLDRDLALSS